MKYTIYAFPSYHGTPWHTNWFLLAGIYLLVRSLRYPEAYVKNNVTGARW